jgi:ABC-2 type transport system permease protein
MKLRLLWRLTAINLMQTLEYRGAFLVYMVNLLAVPVISLLVWLTVRSHSSGVPLSSGQLVTYYILLSVTAMFTSVWQAPYVAENIRLGGLSPWLLRPAPYILTMVGNSLGEKIGKLPLLMPLVLIMALGFHHDLQLPADPAAWLLYVAAVPLAAAVSFLLDFTIGSLAFWLHDVRGLIRVNYLLSGFLAGQFVPLALFPPALRPLLDVQPYRYTLSFPLEVVTGSLSGPEVARGFAWQLGYCLLFYLLYRITWRRGLRAYAGSGA